MTVFERVDLKLSKRATSTGLHRFTKLLGMVLLLWLAPACGGDDQVLGPRCGDGVCLSTETPQSCPRDCDYTCVPGTERCEGNSVAACVDDGSLERLRQCRPGEFCQDGACQEGASFPDTSGDTAGDTSNDITDDAEDTADSDDDDAADSDDDDAADSDDDDAADSDDDAADSDDDDDDDVADSDDDITDAGDAGD